MDQGVQVSTFDTEKRLTQLRQVRAVMKAMTDDFKAKLTPFLQLEARIEGELLQFLLSTKQQNAKTKVGTFYKITKATYSLQDVVEFQRHVIGTESWELLDWHVNKTAADAFRLQHGGKTIDGSVVGGSLPPGAKVNERVTLGVLAPKKPKTETAKTAASSPKDNAANTSSTNEEVDAL